MEDILKVENLSKNYGGFKALDDVTFSIKKGEMFALLGPNGAGKSTLISILSGLFQPSSGTASILGYDILQNSLETKHRIGLVPQEILNHGFFTVEQVLNFHSGYYGISNNGNRIDYLLDRLALEDHRKKKVTQLSGGMKRRFLIAKALIHSPPLLFLDEPTAGVDVDLRNTLWEFVRELNDEGVSILLTTHYLQEAEELCSRIAVLDHGKLISLDTTQNMIEKLTQRDIRITLDSDKAWNGMPNELPFNGNHISLKMGFGQSVGERLAEIKIPMERIQDISITEGNLEDAFMTLLSQQNNNPTGRIE